MDKLKDLKNVKVSNELDYLISEKEISKSIKELKNKKSSGCDSILNEMLKYGHYQLLQPLKKNIQFSPLHFKIPKSLVAWNYNPFA